jgi:hypothetical protein
VAKSSKLASEILAATGIVCLRIVTLPGHPRHSRVTISGIADRSIAGHRIWLRSHKAAERIIVELHRTHGMLRGGTMVIEAVPDEVDRLLRDSARLIGIAVIEDERIDAMMASLTKRAADQIQKLPRSQRTLKKLRGVVDHDLTGLLARQ